MSVSAPVPCPLMASPPLARRVGYNGCRRKPKRVSQAQGNIDEHAAAKARPAAAEPILLREDIAGIAVLTLNRPHARNSLSEAALQALGDALTAISHDRDVRAVVLTANGPAFSAGHDLK